VSGAPGKIDGIVNALRPYRILEMVQTGTVAMTRGADHREKGPANIKAGPLRVA